MLWELMANGSLHRWWDYAAFVAAILVLMTGPLAIRQIWITRPKKEDHEQG